MYIFITKLDGDLVLLQISENNYSLVSKHKATKTLIKNFVALWLRVLFKI